MTVALGLKGYDTGEMTSISSLRLVWLLPFYTIVLKTGGLSAGRRASLRNSSQLPFLSGTAKISFAQWPLRISEIFYVIVAMSTILCCCDHQKSSPQASPKYASPYAVHTQCTSERMYECTNLRIATDTRPTRNTHVAEEYINTNNPYHVAIPLPAKPSDRLQGRERPWFS